MRCKSESGVATIEYASYDSGYRSLRATSAPRKSQKKDYAEDIIRMKREGIPQKDIAFTLGISESYVSSILRNSRR